MAQVVTPDEVAELIRRLAEARHLALRMSDRLSEQGSLGLVAAAGIELAAFSVDEALRRVRKAAQLVVQVTDSND